MLQFTKYVYTLQKTSSEKKSRCQVKGCARKDSSIHRLPKSDFIRRIWIENLQLTSGSDPYVCGLHFEEHDFCKVVSNGPRRLRSIAIPSVNLPESQNVLEESVDEGVLMDSSIYLDESTIDEEIIDEETIHQDEFATEETMMESLIEDELTIQIDSDYGEFISDEDNRLFEEKQLLAFQYHDKSTQTRPKYDVDKCVQANFSLEETMRPWTLLDVLRTDSDLQSWTGIQSFITLDNIVKCVETLESAKEQLKKMKSTPKVLTVFVMAKLKTNLTFKQLACLFSLTPSTLSTYFDNFIPILKTSLEPAIFWPTKEQIFNNLPKCFKPQFDDCFVLMDCTENRIERLKSLESQIKTYSHYKGIVNDIYYYPL